LITRSRNGTLADNVKEPVKLPFIFLFVLLCTTIALAAIDVLATWGMHDSASQAFSFAYAARLFPGSLFAVTIPSVVFSIVILGFRMARKPISRFVGLLIVLAVAYVALVNGMLWFRSLGAAATGVERTSVASLTPGTFVRLGGQVVSVGSLSATKASNVLVFDPGKTQNRFVLYAAAGASMSAKALTLTPGNAPSISGSPDLSWTGIFAPDRFTAAFLRDVATITTDFGALIARSLPEFFAACFSLVFLCATSLMLLRLTRWPLVNIMLLVISGRGFFWLYHALSADLAPQVARIVTDSLVARLFPSVVLAVIGVIFLLIDILFIPADRWVIEGQA
jgi:hypothetical protein